MKFHKANAWKVEHKDDRQCHQGFSSPFTEYDKPRNDGFQIARGILAEVEGHPFDVDKMVLDCPWTVGTHTGATSFT